MTRAQQHLRAKLAGAPTPTARVEAWIAATLALAYDGRTLGLREAPATS